MTRKQKFDSNAKPEEGGKKKTAAKKAKPKAAKPDAPIVIETKDEAQANAQFNENRARPDRETVEARRRKMRGNLDLLNQRKLGVDISKLDFNKYAYRWVHDLPGRISNFQQRSYEIVPNTSDEKTKGVGNDIRATDSQGDLIFMRIPIEFYQDDQREKMRESAEFDKQIREGNLSVAERSHSDNVVNHANTLSG